MALQDKYKELVSAATAAGIRAHVRHPGSIGGVIDLIHSRCAGVAVGRQVGAGGGSRSQTWPVMPARDRSARHAA